MQIKHFAIALSAALLPALACGQGQNFPGSGSSASPSESTWYFAQNCGTATNCTTVKFDANVTQDGSTTSGSNVFTCPNADCKFLTTAKVGQIFFATDNATAPANVTACLNNATITFGGLQQTTISSVDSDTQIHVVGNAGSTSTANACAAWGDDDTTAINNGVNAAPCTANYTFPLGYTLFSLPIIQAVPACPPVASQVAFQGPMVTGQNVVGSFFIPTPGFNFTSIIGGRSTNPASAKAAFGNQNIVQYKDIFIYGIGQRCTATLANTVLLLAGSEARLYNVDGLGWCGQGGGPSLIGIYFAGALDRFDQGGTQFFGSEGVDIESPMVTFIGNFFQGMTSNTATVSRCGIVIGEQTGAAANALFVDGWNITCIGVENGAELTMMHTKTQGNPAGTADTACLFLTGSGSVVNLLSNDQVCITPQSAQTAVSFGATGESLTSSRAAFFGNGTSPVITGIAGSSFIDADANTFTGGAGGVWNGLGNWISDASTVVTPPTISSGFGTSPAILKTSGATSFTVNVGTGGTATAGVIGLSSARNGWTCQVYNQTAHAGNRADDTVQTANTTTTVTVQNQTKSTGAAVAWTASDTLNVSCRAN